jgi:chemotaxis protein histidine kinase CheA
METLETANQFAVESFLPRTRVLIEELDRAERFGDALREQEVIQQILKEVEAVEAWIEQEEQEIAALEQAQREVVTETEPEKPTEKEEPAATEAPKPRTMGRREALEKIGALTAVGLSGMLGGMLLNDKKQSERDTQAENTTPEPKPQPKPEENEKPKEKPEPEKAPVEEKNESKEALPRRAHGLYEYFKGMGKRFVIIEKTSVEMFVFNAQGVLLGQMPALLGTTLGEETNNASEDNETVAKKTTPAGVYRLTYRGITDEIRTLYDDKIIRIEHPQMDLAIHGIYKDEYEERKARLDTPTPHDNFASWGCVNIEQYEKYFGTFTNRKFKEGDLLGVLPDDPNTTIDPETGNIVPFKRS